MPEDNMPNDDLNNLPNDPNVFDSLSSSSSENPAADISEDAEFEELKQKAMNYNYTEAQTEQTEEVKLDSDLLDASQVTVRPVEFTQFDSYTPTNTDTNKNLELLMDIKLELTVELGRCHLPVKKVLELTRGSIIELDKVAGESVELFANGKHVANGEVVVIEDNFGLRITSITDPEERIKSL